MHGAQFGPLCGGDVVCAVALVGANTGDECDDAVSPVFFVNGHGVLPCSLVLVWHGLGWVSSPVRMFIGALVSRELSPPVRANAVGLFVTVTVGVEHVLQFADDVLVHDTTLARGGPGEQSQALDSGL